MCERRVNLFVYSLSLHGHSYIGFILAFASSIHNKQQVLLGTGVSEKYFGFGDSDSNQSKDDTTMEADQVFGSGGVVNIHY